MIFSEFYRLFFFSSRLLVLTLGVGDGQGSLACCSPWGCKELDMTEPLN